MSVPDEGPNDTSLDSSSLSQQDKLAAREREIDVFVHDNLTRNFIAHFAHGMLGMTGFRLIYAPTFVPAYLNLITGSAFWVGFGQSLLQLGGVMSPILGATQIEQKKLVLPAALHIGMMMRVQMLGLALAGWFLTGSALIVSTFIFLFLLGFFTGSQRVAFQVLLAKVIPIRKRGRLQAWRNMVGGAIAALLSYWAGANLIEPEVFGNGYATTFLLSFILTSLGLSVLYMLLKEPESASIKPKIAARMRLAQFRHLLENPDYKFFLIAQTFTIAGRIALPFCIIHAADIVDANGATIGVFTLAFLGADTLTNLLWGNLGDKYGFRSSFIASICLAIFGFFIMMIASSYWHFLLAFFALGASMSGYMMSVTTLVLEFGERADIPMRLALSTTVETTTASITPLLGGVIVSVSGLIPALVLSIGLLLLSLTTVLLKVREPRNCN